MRHLLWIALLLVLISSPALAQFDSNAKPKPNWAVGDKVEVRLGVNWQPAEVVRINPNGILMVKTAVNGRDIEMFALPAHVRAGKADKTKADKTKAPKESPKAPARTKPMGPLASMRTWTDSSGDFSTKGQFVDFQDGVIRLKRESGKISNIPLSRLSDADQKLVKDWLKSQTKTSSKPGKQIRSDWSQVKNVVLQAPRQWSLKPSQAAAVAQSLVERPISLSAPLGDDGFFEKVSHLGFDREKGIAFLSRVNARPGKPVRVSIERCDLAAGKSLGAQELPDDLRPLTVDPSGQFLVTRSDARGFGGNGQLEIWRLSEAELQRVYSFEPYGEEKGRGKDVAFARFLDPKHLLTLGGDKLTLWKLPDGKAVYSVKIKDQPAVNAGGDYLAIISDQGMFVLAAKTGEVLGSLAGDKGVFAKLAMSDNGARVAMFAQGRLQVWDCQRGERIRDIFLPSMLATGDLHWIDDDHLLIGANLVDVPRRVIAWRYDGLRSQGRTYGGQTWFPFGRQADKVLLPLAIPHEAARRALGGARPERLLVFQPGDSIRLEFELPAAENHKDQIRQALAARLSENDVAVDPQAKLVLKAVSRKGQTRKINYRGFGFLGGPAQTVQVTGQVYKLELRDGDQIIWQASLTKHAPPLLHLKRNQSIEEALADYTRPDISFFINQPLPRVLARPGKSNGAYGSSRVTAQGILGQ